MALGHDLDYTYDISLITTVLTFASQKPKETREGFWDGHNTDVIVCVHGAEQVQAFSQCLCA